MKNRKYLLFLALIVIPISWSSACASNWTYVNPLRPDISFTISEEPASFIVIDLRQGANFCSDKSRYKCVTTEGFEFHVPRDYSASTENWTIGDSHYKVVDNYDKVSLLGIKSKLVLIEKKAAKGSSYYIYSKSRGLLGFGASDDVRSTQGLYLLAGKCGFAAATDCLFTDK